VTLHPLQMRWYAEDLVRLRRSDELRRYAAPQRSGHIDANPHQIEAVIFALSRLGEGGCILADEVGLGKTIEAGLVIAQLRAEGARRILLIVPKPLLGQWRQELFTLFGIEAREGRPDMASFEGDGVFLAGREAAGGERGRAVLLASDPFDLIVIDEAHEIFSGLHRRFDAAGNLRDESPSARMAGRIFDLISACRTPVLLLTATPIQNNLSELWALVRFVDPTGTLLGDLRTFRDTFCDRDERDMTEGQSHELRRRTQVVLKRTLRRQAQEFLSRPFVDRQARLYEYPMSAEERLLYEDVTHYLLEPNLAAFQGNHRRLLLIGFHRLMASSTAALAASLDKVAGRLRRLLEGMPEAEAAGSDFVADLEDEDLVEQVDEPGRDSPREPDSIPAAVAPEKMRGELARVEDFILRANALRDDGKSRALLKAVRLIFDRGRRGLGSGKVVIFTESLVTQDYLRRLLVGSGLVHDEELTLFRGDNVSPRASQALERWWDEVGSKLPAHSRPTRDVAVRLGLVHEFKTRSRVLVSTEAGAKGLNLQFCETVVNYDLPWNPQRIEQRIGRCHRYGQERDVTVINFLARDNQAARLTFDILSRKLDLFGTVLDASDVVLHRPGEPAPEVLAGTFGVELEASLNRIWERARTIAEVEAELRRLRDSVGEKRERFEDERNKTARLIESAFDEEVRGVFAKRRDELPAALAEFDADLERLVTSYLAAIGAGWERLGGESGTFLRVEPCAALPEGLREGLTVAVGASRGTDESLHLSHPLVLSAIAAARTPRDRTQAVAIRLGPEMPAELVARRSRRGRFALLRVRYEGLEPVERLIPVALFEGDETALAPHLSEALLLSEIRDLPGPPSRVAPDETFEDIVAEALFADRQAATSGEAGRFDRGLEQVERYVEDRVLLRRRERGDLERRSEQARARRDAALSLDVREEAEVLLGRLAVEIEALEAEIDRLERRDDDTYRRCRERLLARRYSTATVERLFEMEMLLE
jgi:hypothetical protein